MNIKRKMTGIIAVLLALVTAVSFSACSAKNTEESTAVAESESGAISSESTDTESVTDKINAIYQEENKIFSEHKDLWDKAFEVLSGTTADVGENYGDYLYDTINGSKDTFTDEELTALNEDIEKIRDFENQIADLQTEAGISYDESTDSVAADESAVKDISGKDFDGNDIDSSIFSNNAVTVLNFWFTGCKPCVAELSRLNEMNEELKSMGGEVIGVNTSTNDYNEAAIEEAKQVLESQGASYRNLSIDSNTAAGAYANDIIAYPTTILVDRNGNIVGEPFLGGVDDEDNYNSLMERIKTVIEQDSASN